MVRFLPTLYINVIKVTEAKQLACLYAVLGWQSCFYAISGPVAAD